MDPRPLLSPQRSGWGLHGRMVWGSLPAPIHNGGVGMEQSLGKALEFGAGSYSSNAHLSAGDFAHSHAEIHTSFRCQDDLA